MKYMNIGEAAAAAQVTPKMIRHYESLSLIPQVDRTEAGYRLYTPREVEMLRFIRQSRALDFSMQQIGALLALWHNQERESRAVKDLARQQLIELDARQRELDEMRKTLSSLIEDCAGDQGASCPILDRLADPLPMPCHTETQRASNTLKQVKAGSSAPDARKTRKVRPALAPAGSHSGLTAWSRSFAPTA
jgi:Cu(I)-responsive transcriptional regulator